MQKQGLILTISALSGTGKDSVCSALLKMDENISFFATATTRDKREGEQDGIDYHFLTQEKFMQDVKDGKFMEWVKLAYNGHYYGTLRHVIEDKLNQGLDVTSDLTWDGVATMKKEWPDQTVRFLLMPPSAEELEKRLYLRSQKSAENIENTKKRIVSCMEDAKRWQENDYQFTSTDLVGSNLKDYDYVIINENLDDTVNKVHNIIKQERAKRG
jgi:guanylate kinase